MSEKDTIFSGKIKQAGLFNFKDFYSFVYEWLEEDGYFVVEKQYSEKIAGDSKDIEIRWEARKKVSDYFRFTIKIDWRILGMKSVEAQKGDKKIKTNTGILEIKFTGVLERDHEGQWETNAFMKFLRGVYDRYIIRSRIEDYEGKLYDETQEIVDQCKAFLVLETKK